MFNQNNYLHFTLVENVFSLSNLQLLLWHGGHLACKQNASVIPHRFSFRGPDPTSNNCEKEGCKRGVLL